MKDIQVLSKIRYVKKAAIFDIDGTILKNLSSERVFFRYLLEKKVVTFKDLLQFARVFLKNLFNLKGIYLRRNKYYLKNREYAHIVSDMDQCFQERISLHISAIALAEIARLRRDGYFIILMSGTLSPLVDCFVKRCNAHIGFGTSLGVDNNGKITGEIDGIHAYSSGKVKVLNRLAAEYNIDLSSSYAFANQYLDAKFMRMVGNPVTVNASTLLLFHAKVHKWKIMEF